MDSERLKEFEKLDFATGRIAASSKGISGVGYDDVS